jgi:hypothetical protein
MCKKDYALAKCFAEHSNICEKQSGFLELNGKYETIKRGLEEEATERKEDVKKIREELEVVEAKLVSAADKDFARRQESEDFTKNQSRIKILLFSGLKRSTDGETKMNIVSEFIKINLGIETTDSVKITRVSFFAANKKHTLKVEFNTDTTARFILKAAFDKKINQIKEWLTVDTKIRRMILNVYADHLTSEVEQVTVPEIGSRPHLLITNKKENWSLTLPFVDAMSKFEDRKIGLDSVFQYLQEIEHDKNLYRNVLLSFPV